MSTSCYRCRDRGYYWREAQHYGQGGIGIGTVIRRCHCEAGKALPTDLVKWRKFEAAVYEAERRRFS